MSFFKLLRFVCFVCVLTPAAPALGGAFLQPRGMLLAIAESTAGYLSWADPRGEVRLAARTTLDTILEYGLHEWVTLLGRVNNTRIQMTCGCDAYLGYGSSEWGVRVQLRRWDLYILSAQITERFPASRWYGNPWLDGLVDRETDARIMAGGSFYLRDRPGFWSLEAGIRKRMPWHGNEYRLEFTGGYMFHHRWQAMLQVFNVLAEPNILFVRNHYHKVQPTIVFNPGRPWSIQFGGFFTPLAVKGRRETGLLMAYWRRF